MNKLLQELVIWIKVIVCVFVVFVLINIYVFESMEISTNSMYPALKPGDKVFVEKITYSHRDPELGEVVVFWTPFVDKEFQKVMKIPERIVNEFSADEFRGRVKYVKRLIGKSGDVIELTPDRG